MNAGQAYVQAAMALERVAPCILDAQAYGPAKCRTHDGGTRFTNHNGPGNCNRAGTEGLLREALANLVGSLTLEVKP